jgi:RHS repeat-associated protein
MGNMLSLTLGTAHTATFSYLGTTPKLTSVTENGSPTSVGYDSAGNETQGAVGYSPRNYRSGWRTGNRRMGSCSTTSFSYDGRGVRANQLFVNVPGCAGCSTTSSTDSIYTPELNLLYVTNTTTILPEEGTFTWSSEFVWFAGRPVAEEAVNGLSATTLWLFGDHLGTPAIRTDAMPTINSFTEYEPYGPVAANRAGSPPLLRFPGQEGDGYNIFRWYRPNWGRYSQADPIGLRGGLHLYAYANLNALSSIDPHGDRWERRCCNGFDNEHLLARLNQVADLQKGTINGFLPPPLPWSPSASTTCSNRTPTTAYDNLGGGSCIDLCVRAHEQYHRDECRTGFYDKMTADRSILPWFSEAMGYLREYQCLKDALFQGFVTANVDPIASGNR